MGLLLEITGAGLGPRWCTKYKRNKVLQFCPRSQLASSLTVKKKKKYIYIWSLRNFQNCSLEDGSWLHEVLGC